MLAAHQPDLFPYPGFWAKMARADLFDVAIFDQFQRKGYQRRVAMRGDWSSIPVIGADQRRAIKDVEIEASAPEVLQKNIIGRYRGSRHWDEYGDLVCGWIEEARSNLLWLFNLHLIVKMRDLLLIETPLSIARQPRLHGARGIVDVCTQYPGVTQYLSGTGARVYIDEEGEQYINRFVDLRWLAYKSPTSDSILTLLFDRGRAETMHLITKGGVER